MGLGALDAARAAARPFAAHRGGHSSSTRALPVCSLRRGQPGGGPSSERAAATSTASTSASTAVETLTRPAAPQQAKQTGNKARTKELDAYKKLVKSGKLHAAVTLLEQLHAEGDLAVAERVSHKAFFRRCTHKHVLSAGFRFVRLLKKPSTQAYNLLIRSCARARDSHAAFKAFDSLRKAGLVPGTHIYTTLISACAKAGRLTKAMRVYGEMRSEGVSVNEITYGALLDALSRRLLLLGRTNQPGRQAKTAIHLDQAFSLWKEMKEEGLSPDATAYNSLICACGRSSGLVPDALDRAILLLNEMRAVGLEMDSFTCATLINSFARAGQPERGLMLYTEIYRRELMQSHDAESSHARVIRSPVVFTAAVHSCALISDFPQAKAIYEEYCRHFDTVDAVLVSALLTAAFKSEGLDRAFEVFESIKTEASDTRIDACIIGFCAQAGEVERAEQVFCGILERASATDKPTIDAYNNLLSAHSAVGNVERCWQLYDEMIESRLVPDSALNDSITFKALVIAGTRAGDADQALRAWEELKRSHVKLADSAYLSLLRVCAQEGRVETIHDIMADLEQGNVQLSAEIYACLIQALGRRKLFDDAFKLLEEMMETGKAGKEAAEAAALATLEAAAVSSRAESGDEDENDGEADSTADDAVDAAALASAAAAQASVDFADSAVLPAPTLGCFEVFLGAAARANRPDIVWEGYKLSGQAGVEPSAVLCSKTAWACLAMSRQVVDEVNNADTMSQVWAMQAAQPMWVEWAERAAAVYRATVQAGNVPAVETLSTLFACLKLPEFMRPGNENWKLRWDKRNRDPEHHLGPHRVSTRRAAANAAYASFSSSGLASQAGSGSVGGGAGGATGSVGALMMPSAGHWPDEYRLYPDRGFLIFEEAQSLGIIPAFQLERPGEIDLRHIPPAAADMAILTYLRVQNRRRAASANQAVIHDLTLRVRTPEETMELLSHANAGSLESRLSRTGMRIESLLRKINLEHKTRFDAGEIRIPGYAIAEWLQPQAPAGSFMGVTGGRSRAATRRTVQEMAKQRTWQQNGAGDVPWTPPPNLYRPSQGGGAGDDGYTGGSF
mmetsp:Transcript_7934/g.26349  ORF Transcript_7934/g.26349 Transcript_7934/m.26349 type:complete len:1076 (-) Transcript_7934:54-3281(-)